MYVHSKDIEYKNDWYPSLSYHKILRGKDGAERGKLKWEQYVERRLEVFIIVIISKTISFVSFSLAYFMIEICLVKHL